MPRPSIPSLAFLAPGLLHQFGNQLFSIQGSAQLLPDDAVALRTRILAATARGGETLRVLRALLGDPAPLRLPLAQTLEPLVDVARVALREHGHQIRSGVGAATDGGAVDAVAVVERTAQALCLLCEAVPTGAVGTFTIEGATGGAATVVSVTFQSAAGSLPFPLATRDVCEGLEHASASAPNRPSYRQVPTGIVLSFPMAAAAAEHEA